MRRIAFILAFVLFLSSIPNIGLKNAHAAILNLNLSREFSLTLGNNNDNPILNRGGQPTNAWMFYWPVTTEGLGNNESAQLSYQIANDRKLNVKTTYVDGITDVELYLTDDADVKIPVNDNNYNIYSIIDTDYVPITKFIDNTGVNIPGYNDGETKQVVSGKINPTDTETQMAKFWLDNLNGDVGYSIKYGVYDFHFLLGNDGNFYFYQLGRFEEGNVYDVTLTHYDSINGIMDQVEKSVGLGLNMTNAYATPFIDIKGTEADREYDDSPYQIAERGSISIGDTDLVGFDYTFKLPLRYNTATKMFDTPVDTESTVIGTFLNKGTEEIKTTLKVQGNEASVDIDVANGNLPAGATATAVVNADHTITVTYRGLNSGVVLTPQVKYDNEKIEFKEYNNVVAKAYTFPEYTILHKDGADYVSITPFEGYSGHYVLFSGVSSSPKLSMAAGYFKENASTSEPISLPLSPIPENGSVTNYQYKLFFNPDERFPNPADLMLNDYSDKIRTRFFTYIAQDKGSIGFPNNFEVKNINQSKMFVPDSSYTTDGSGNYSDDFQDLSYTLTWDIGKMSSIDNMLNGGTADVNYVVSLGNTLESNAREDYLSVDITLDGSQGADNATLLTSSGDFLMIEEVTPRDEYNKFIDARLVTAYSPQASAYVYRLEVDVENVIIDREEVANYLNIAKGVYFRYPNIYFATVAPTLVDINGIVTNFDKKAYSSTIEEFTLNKDLSLTLQEPVNIQTSNMKTQFKDYIDSTGKLAPKDIVSFDLSYQTQQTGLHAYMKYYFTNTDLQQFGQNMHFTNDIYISQDLDKMKNLIPNLDKQGRIDNSIELALPNDYASSNVNNNGLPVIMMRNFANNTGITDPYEDPIAIKTEDNRDGVDVLRQDEILRISNLTTFEPEFDENGNFVLPEGNILNKVEINGLDTNTKYYIYVDANVKYESEGGKLRYLDVGTNNPFIEHSNISALTSGTTGSYLQQPSIVDEVPTMPDVELVEVGRNNSIIKFDMVDMEISEPNRYEQEFKYEVLRIRGTRLPEEYLDTRKDLQHVFDNEIAPDVIDKAAQLLYEDAEANPSVLQYDYNTNTFITPPEESMYLQSYDQNTIYYEDNSLSSNRVYFVYVRTVREITDLQTGKTYKNYSAWDVISATTILGDAPVELEVLYEYSTSYDEQTQIPLQFKAKVPNLQDIGSEFTFEATYRYAGQDWVVPITIDSTQLRNNASEIDAEGYRTFKFLLSDLEPGTAYSIKVRQANSDGSFTPYSNIAQWKTDIDEDDYDKEDELDSFEDLMDDKVDSLIDGSQIILENDDDEKIIMINGNNLTNEIANMKANTIMLNSLEKGKDNVIILPAEAYRNANDKNLAWQFSYKDMFFNVSPNTINETYNEDIISMNKKVKNRIVEDYYYEIKYEYQYLPYRLQSDDKLTDVVNISVELRATTENVLDFQKEELINTLEEVKNSPQAIAKKERILRDIANNVTNENSLELVDDYVEYIEEMFKKDMQAKLRGIRTERDDEQLNELDKNIILGTNYENIFSKVTAYRVNNERLAMPIPTTRSKYVTTTVVRDFGTYGFGGNKVDIVGDIPDSENNISNIVAENDLENTLSDIGSVVTTNANMTVLQGINAISNISGLTVTETKSLLSNKGVVINRNNESKNLTEDLALAMIGILYEQQNGINVNSIAIKDYNYYNKLKNSSINQGYIKYIQLCKEVGIVSNVPSTTKAVTVGQFLSMLSRI